MLENDTKPLKIRLLGLFSTRIIEIDLWLLYIYMDVENNIGLILQTPRRQFFCCPYTTHCE